MLLCPAGGSAESSAGAPCVQENKAALAVTLCENNAEAVKYLEAGKQQNGICFFAAVILSWAALSHFLG